MPIIRRKSRLAVSAKLLLGIFLIYLVFTKIEVSKVFSLIRTADIYLLVLAVFFVSLAQSLGGLRMRYYLIRSGIIFSKLYAVSFYFIGAMLNTVVPGGIGGDGYKVYYFWKKYRFPWRKTILTVIRGRASALFFLFLSLIIVSILYIDIGQKHFPKIEMMLFTSLVILFPAYAIIAKKVLNERISTLLGAFVYSAPLQCCYITASILILASLGVEPDVLGYILVFQIANIVAVVPISIGGIGIREYTFILVAGYIGLELDTGIAASIIFYAVYSLTALFGAIPYFFLEKLDEMQKKEMDQYNPSRLF